MWKGTISGEIKAELLQYVLSIAFLPLLSGHSVNIVAGGKQRCNITIDEIAFEMHKQQTSLTLHVLFPLHGGGGKDNQRVQIKNSLASTPWNKGLTFNGSVTSQVKYWIKQA